MGHTVCGPVPKRCISSHKRDRLSPPPHGTYAARMGNRLRMFVAYSSQQRGQCARRKQWADMWHACPGWWREADTDGRTAICGFRAQAWWSENKNQVVVTTTIMDANSNGYTRKKKRMPIGFAGPESTDVASTSGARRHHLRRMLRGTGPRPCRSCARPCQELVLMRPRETSSDVCLLMHPGPDGSDWRGSCVQGCAATSLLRAQCRTARDRRAETRRVRGHHGAVANLHRLRA